MKTAIGFCPMPLLNGQKRTYPEAAGPRESKVMLAAFWRAGTAT